MLIGYARVSTIDQNADLQLDALGKAGVERTFTDHGVSGSLARRPELDKCLAHLREGDTLVIWKLDRLGRSLRNLLELVDELSSRGIGLKSVTENLDTTTASGRLVLNVFASLGEFERELIRERTAAGLEAAKARGVRVGRPSAVTRDQLAQAQTLVAAGHRVSDVARSLGVGRSTLYRALQEGAA